MLSEDFYSAKCSCKILLSNSYRCVIHSDLCLWLKFQNINVIIIIFESLLLNFYDINKKNWIILKYRMEWKLRKAERLNIFILFLIKILEKRISYTLFNELNMIKEKYFSQAHLL